MCLLCRAELNNNVGRRRVFEAIPEMRTAAGYGAGICGSMPTWGKRGRVQCSAVAQAAQNTIVALTMERERVTNDGRWVEGWSGCHIYDGSVQKWERGVGRDVGVGVGVVGRLSA